MSRNRRRGREPASSYWEPGNYRSSYDDEYHLRHYAPPSGAPFTPRSFNYWRDESGAAAKSYFAQHRHGQARDDERRRDDGRSRDAARSPYSRRRGDSGPRRDWDDRASWRDRNPPASRQRYATDAAPPYIRPPTFRARSPPVESGRPVPPGTSHWEATPPPKKTSPLTPSAGYLSLSQEPSEVVYDRGVTRKLLVLDLNGTLLIRSARSRVASRPQLRAVQPRPYMRSFREYLFAPETKAWLDTMVWSSAQPHSVDDMVDKVFGISKDDLKAVWNRQSLGLSVEEYHRKTVTTKDLTKPWKLLSLGLSAEELEGEGSSALQSQVMHSAFTTLLLDDSPHKAVLQPYNHICIPEYDSARRRHDLQSLEHKEGKRSRTARQQGQVEAAASSRASCTSHSEPVGAEVPAGGAPSPSAEKEPFDATLLAVIGILEAIKLESNVAGWIRRGGLWARGERIGEVGALDVEAPRRVDKAALSTVVQTGNDASSTSDPAVMSEQAHLRTTMWFDDASVLAYWVARGRRAMTEVGVEVWHGVTG